MYSRPTVSCLPISARSLTLTISQSGFSTEMSNVSSPGSRMSVSAEDKICEFHSQRGLSDS